jgi:hypothetical protein
MAEESQAAGKALLAALTTRLVHAAFDAGHGFAHFAHAREGGTVFSTGKTKTTLVNRCFARFGSHVIPLTNLVTRLAGSRGSILTVNGLGPLCCKCVQPTQGSKAKACK